MTYQIEVARNPITVKSDSGAIVAWLPDGSDQIVYDPLADTREALGMVDHRVEMANAGIDAVMMTMIAMMPKTDLMKSR